MKSMQKKFSLFLVLLAAFIDYLGVGLVFPLFALLLFDPQCAILAPGASDAVRGMWLGLLIALGPAVLFFSSPLLGTISDTKGRRKMLILSLGIGIIGYIIAVMGVLLCHIWLLLISRVLYGISAGSMTVVQAAIVDLSTKEEKPKNFGLFSMALGAGFSIGPFIGGVLGKPTLTGWLNYSTPFVVAAILTLINWVLIIWKFKETCKTSKAVTPNWTLGFEHLKKAFKMKELRLVFLVMFLFFFGWDFFVEFAPVFLIKRYGFNGIEIGSFYLYTGLLYAACAGFLIRPIIKRFSSKTVLESALILAGSYFFLFLLVKTVGVMSVYLIPLIYCISLIYPTATTIISNDAAKDAQGEVLGIYGSIQSVALIVSPFCAGSIVGKYPMFGIIVAGSLMLIAGIILSLNKLRLRRVK